MNTGHTESTSAKHARELLANAQQALLSVMYYVRIDDIGFTETELKAAIQRIEKLQAKLPEVLPDEHEVSKP